MASPKLHPPRLRCARHQVRVELVPELLAEGWGTGPSVVCGHERRTVVGQRSVEILIGRLVTDEDLRQRFIAEPRETIRFAQQSGLDLTAAEIDALLASPVVLWERLAAILDPRLQKASLKRG